MRWIYVVAMTAILTQPIAALILICGFGLTKIEQSIGLPLTLVGFTKILSLLAAGLVPFGMISLGYVKVVRAQIDGGNLDSSGDGKATVDNSYAESPLGRSMSQGAPAGLQLSNSSRLFGSASSVYQGAGNKGFFTSQAAQSAAGAAMVAVGHPEMAQLASRAAGSYVTRNLTAPGPTPPPAPNKPNDDPAGTPADDKSGSLPDPTKPSDQKPTTPPSSPRFGDTSKGSDTNQ